MKNNLIDIVKNEKTIALLAPSFPADFEFPKIITDIRKIGFDKVVELTYAAKLINQRYRKIIKENIDMQHICTNCPTVTKYILNKYPQHKDKLINIASPMVIMSRIAKKEFGEDYKTVFIGPCLAKKVEAQESGDVDFAITFKELQEIFDEYKNNNLEYCDYDKSNITEAGDPDFDKFYNDYTKIYPLTGAVADTMHYQDILTKEQILSCDQIPNIDNGIKKIEKDKNIKFFDPLACKGGCIGGPGFAIQKNIEQRKKDIFDYQKYCKKDKIGSKLGKIEYCPDIKFQNNLIK
ncbi:MAG TPA: [Fe-Fe] hydrogenase large subunit C-terminal domain-containing protein [Candidatus Absconditabacterales bacterium]|nr:[Fe-Fe] hydrogenase large subunit C-terminal domain-containing protein [Candidatus Absconditabacterales bacterium]